MRHTRVGVWDIYEEVHPEVERIPLSSRWVEHLESLQGLPYVWRMLKELAGLRDCWGSLLWYLALTGVTAVVPAITLWYVFNISRPSYLP